MSVYKRLVAEGLEVERKNNNKKDLSVNDVIGNFVEMLTHGVIASAFRKRQSYIRLNSISFKENGLEPSDLMKHVIEQKWIALLSPIANNVCAIGRVPYYIETQTFSFNGVTFKESFPVGLEPWEYEYSPHRDFKTRQIVHEFRMRDVQEQPEIFSIPSLSFTGFCIGAKRVAFQSELGLLHDMWVQLNTRKQTADLIRQDMVYPKLYLERTVNALTQNMDIAEARFRDHLEARKVIDKNGYVVKETDISLQYNPNDNSIILPHSAKLASFQNRIDPTVLDYQQDQELFHHLVDQTFGLAHVDRLNANGRRNATNSEAAMDESKSALVTSIESTIAEYKHVLSEIWKHIHVDAKRTSLDIDIPFETHVDMTSITTLYEMGMIDDKTTRDKLLHIHGIPPDKAGRSRPKTDTSTGSRKKAKRTGTDAKKRNE